MTTGRFIDTSTSLVLVGKKNLEVRPSAVNKGEIVKRILYQNPDAEFVFCAGDDKVSFPRSGLCITSSNKALFYGRPTRTCSVHCSSLAHPVGRSLRNW